MNNSLKEGAVTAAQVQQPAIRALWWVDVAGAAAAAVAAQLTWVVTSVGGVDLASGEGGAVQHGGGADLVAGDARGSVAGSRRARGRRSPVTRWRRSWPPLRSSGC